MTAAWTPPSVVRDRAAAWWRGGRLLRELHAPGDPPLFPRRVRLVRPAASEVGGMFAEVRAWAEAHRQAARAGGWQVVVRRVPVRALGPQEVPVAVVVPDAATALAQLGPRARRDAAAFARCLGEAGAAGPWAGGVALDRPLDVVAAAGDWPALLAVAGWVAANPRPGVHVRRLPVPGAHSKLVEDNRSLLAALLAARLPAAAVDASAATFEERFGFATGERHVVLRAPGTVVGLPHLPGVEVTWPAAGLAGVDPAALGVAQVVVVENRACLGAVPAAPGRVVVWGAGYGAGELLAGVPWLDRVDVVYWGDVDTHGLAILSGVRAAVPGVRSVLMDAATLDAHLARAGTEPVPRADDLPHLTAGEQELYDRLRATGLRLEQEHVPPAAVAAALPGGG